MGITVPVVACATEAFPYLGREREAKSMSKREEEEGARGSSPDGFECPREGKGPVGCDLCSRSSSPPSQSYHFLEFGSKIQKAIRQPRECNMAVGNGNRRDWSLAVGERV